MKSVQSVSVVTYSDRWELVSYLTNDDNSTVYDLHVINLLIFNSWAQYLYDSEHTVPTADVVLKAVLFSSYTNGNNNTTNINAVATLLTPAVAVLNSVLLIAMTALGMSSMYWPQVDPEAPLRTAAQQGVNNVKQV